jgi:hypothetical protein
MATEDPRLQELRERIERLDGLIAGRDDGSRGLGVRLALGIALEIQEGKAPGTDTGSLVADWTARFGAETVDDAVAQARALLADPARMAVELQARMNPPNPEADRA